MSKIWAAEQVLDVHPDGKVLTCSGTTVKGDSCQNHINPADKQLAKHVINTLSMLDVVALGVNTNIVAHMVRSLVLCTLCKGVHRKQNSQVTATTEKFRQNVLRFVTERQNPINGQRQPRSVAVVNPRQAALQPEQQLIERRNRTGSASNISTQVRVSRVADPQHQRLAMDVDTQPGLQLENERRYEAASNRLQLNDRQRIADQEARDLALAQQLAQESRLQNGRQVSQRDQQHQHQQGQQDFEMAQRFDEEDGEALAKVIASRGQQPQPQPQPQPQQPNSHMSLTAILAQPWPQPGSMSLEQPTPDMPSEPARDPAQAQNLLEQSAVAPRRIAIPRPSPAQRGLAQTSVPPTFGQSTPISPAPYMRDRDSLLQNGPPTLRLNRARRPGAASQLNVPLHQEPPRLTRTPALERVRPDWRHALQPSRITSVQRAGASPQPRTVASPTPAQHNAAQSTASTQILAVPAANTNVVFGQPTMGGPTVAQQAAGTVQQSEASTLSRHSTEVPATPWSRGAPSPFRPSRWEQNLQLQRVYRPQDSNASMMHPQQLPHEPFPGEEFSMDAYNNVLAPNQRRASLSAREYAETVPPSFDFQHDNDYLNRPFADVPLGPWDPLGPGQNAFLAQTHSASLSPADQDRLAQHLPLNLPLELERHRLSLGNWYDELDGAQPRPRPPRPNCSTPTPRSTPIGQPPRQRPRRQMPAFQALSSHLANSLGYNINDRPRQEEQREHLAGVDEEVITGQAAVQEFLARPVPSEPGLQSTHFEEGQSVLRAGHQSIVASQARPLPSAAEPQTLDVWQNTALRRSVEAYNSVPPRHFTLPPRRVLDRGAAFNPANGSAIQHGGNHLQWQHTEREAREVREARQAWAHRPNRAPARRASLSDECYICYNNFQEGGADAVWCQGQCGKNVHRDCFEEWRRLALWGGGTRCPHCRGLWHQNFQY